MKLSILVPYKPDYGERDIIWQFVRKRYEKYLPDIELCVGCDNSPDSSCSLPINKAALINRAALKANGDVFIISDADVIFDFRLINLIREHIKNRKYLIPFSRGVRLSKKATLRLLEGYDEDIIKMTQDDIDLEISPPGSLMNVITRETFERINGFDERFVGWGYEDIAFIELLKRLYGEPYRIIFQIYHLWHTPSRESSNYDFNKYSEKNLQLLMSYKAADTPEKMQKLVTDRIINNNISFLSGEKNEICKY